MTGGSLHNRQYYSASEGTVLHRSVHILSDDETCCLSCADVAQAAELSSQNQSVTVHKILEGRWTTIVEGQC